MADCIMENLINRFERKFIPEALSGCWIWSAGANYDGYGNFSIGKKTYNAHRISYEIYVGKIPDGMCVLHRCDNTYCVSPSHLFVGSRKTNTQDMIKKNRRGNCNKKLSIDDVSRIKSDTRSCRSISVDYGVHESTIYALKTGRTWGKK